ncbi:MAG: hypothetical protein Q7S50_01310 [bacterium]|nr:hypothetical protein [bacterium]
MKGDEFNVSERILMYAFVHAAVAAAYVAGVAYFMANAKDIVGPQPGYIGITVFLLVFSTSAAIMGMLVFGRPVLWFMAGAKLEAVQLAVSTVAFLALIAFVIFLFLV